MPVWKRFNPNPCGKSVGDCAVRAVAAALNLSWKEAFLLLCDKALELCDLPSSDAVWGAVLRSAGFERYGISNTCPDCYTAADFARDHPRGVFVLAFGGHVATIRHGVLLDSWNSENEIPIYYFRRS